MNRTCQTSIVLLIIFYFFMSPAVAETQREIKARDYFSDRILLDQDGRRFRFFSDLLQNRTVLLNVVFTNCEDACSLITRRLLETSQALGESFGTDIHFISISIDPQRDTPERLKAFAKEAGADLPGWRFVVGTPEDTQYVLSKLGQWSEDENDHSTLLLAGKPSFAHWAKLPPHAVTAQIVAKLNALHGGS